MTDIDPKHREFFEKLKALCEEYCVYMRGHELIEFDFAEFNDHEYTVLKFNETTERIFIKGGGEIKL